METILVKELMTATGLTYRQIDYWCRKKVIIPINDENVSTGFAREFDKEIIPRVQLIASISKSFKNHIPLEILKEIYDNYEEGRVYLGPGVYIQWRTPEDHY